MSLTDGLPVCANSQLMQALLDGVACNILLSSFKHHIKNKCHTASRPLSHTMHRRWRRFFLFLLHESHHGYCHVTPVKFIECACHSMCSCNVFVWSVACRCRTPFTLTNRLINEDLMQKSLIFWMQQCNSIIKQPLIQNLFEHTRRSHTMYQVLKHISIIN